MGRCVHVGLRLPQNMAGGVTGVGAWVALRGLLSIWLLEKVLSMYPHPLAGGSAASKVKTGKGEGCEWL